MNVEEVKGFMELSIEELSTAQFLFDGGLYRACVTHAYYAIFNSAKALLLTKDFSSKKHEPTISMFSKLFVNEDDFSKDIFQYYSDAKELRKLSSYDFSVDFDKHEVYSCLVHAEEFVIEAKRRIELIIED